ncbi:hypothetical protein IJM86_07625 [bacterium]|nr:hypothetical protein [bacterium]
MISSENYLFNDFVNNENSSTHLYSFIRKNDTSQIQYSELLNITLMIPAYTSSKEYS